MIGMVPHWRRKSRKPSLSRQHRRRKGAPLAEGKTAALSRCYFNGERPALAVDNGVDF